MRAIEIREIGGPAVLQPVERPVPALTGPTDVLVRLMAAGVNPVDTKLRSRGPLIADGLPMVPGCDGAGVVEAIGPSVTHFQPGEEVYWFDGGLGYKAGNYAEFAVVHEDCLARKPARLSMIEAAAAPLALITAWEALVDRGALQKEQTVLVHAGAGGVGHIAVQLARHMGAFVATTVSNEEKVAFVRSLGAELAIDYTREDFVEAALEWTGGNGVKVVFDTVGGDVFCRSFSAARVYGHVISLLSTVCDQRGIDTARMRNLTIGYVQMTAPAYLGLHPARLAQTRILEAGARLFDSGALKVHVSHALPLKEARLAHKLIEHGHTTGKVVLRVAP